MAATRLAEGEADDQLTPWEQLQVLAVHSTLLKGELTWNKVPGKEIVINYRDR